MTSSTPAYYEKGSVELAVESPVMMRRLEKRHHLTSNSERLMLVLVGLPARGKSFLARKLVNYLTWRGNKCQIFNVGKYRRAAAANVDQHADFFDDTNETAAKLRQQAAEAALKDTLEWLLEDEDEKEEDSSHTLRRQYQRVAIFDATNSTRERRKWILQQCKLANETTGKTTGVVFVESICNDKELLQENFLQKISSCPDFDNCDAQEALADLQERVHKYESRYESMGDDDTQSYIQIFNLSSKILVNHVYGRLAKVIVPALMGWHTGSRPIYLCRAGETATMQKYMSGEDLSKMVGKTPKRMRGDRLGERGLRFRDALCDFVEREGIEFMNRKQVTVSHPREMDTGTSISGLLPPDHPHRFRNDSYDASSLPFPCLVMSSTMPRALETASWRIPFPVKDVSNLNPLDMGDFAGMDLEGIRKEHPEWYEQLEQEPFHTRFPGGESYSDLINRLESAVVDMEQQLGPAVVVSHVSVIQVLLAYFRSTPVAECTGLEIPMHTVFKFVPLRGGGWLESQHNLLPDEEDADVKKDSPSLEKPIWGDSRSCLPQKLNT